MSNLVGKPENRFSRDEAQIYVSINRRTKLKSDGLSKFILLLHYYTHGKKLGNTSCVTRVNFRLKVSYILKLFKQNYIQSCFNVKLTNIQQSLWLAAAILDTEIKILILGPH